MSEELDDEILGNLLFVERTPKLEIAKFIFNLSDSLDKVNSNNRMFAESYAENYKELLDIQKERNQLKIENERLKEALHLLDNWTKAYPLEVFPEPDLKLTRKLLTDGGVSYDALNAYSMRHVINGIAEIVHKALSEEK